MKENPVVTPPRAPLSHAVAVTGYVYRGGQFLLLKRKNPPLIWAPPGGRLGTNEDPKEGVLREIREETGLEVRILGLVDSWFGDIPSRGLYLSLDYLTAPAGEAEVVLSEEHSDSMWSSIEDLERGHPSLEGASCGFRISDFHRAQDAHRFLTGPPRV